MSRSQKSKSEVSKVNPGFLKNSWRSKNGPSQRALSYEWKKFFEKKNQILTSYLISPIKFMINTCPGSKILKFQLGVWPEVNYVQSRFSIKFIIRWNSSTKIFIQVIFSGLDQIFFSYKLRQIFQYFPIQSSDQNFLKTS